METGSKTDRVIDWICDHFAIVYVAGTALGLLATTGIVKWYGAVEGRAIAKELMKHIPAR